MAFKGYWLRVGTSENDYYEIPERLIQVGSLQILDSTNDLDSYRDANGVLHRDSVLDHTVTKIEFNTPYMYSDKFDTFMGNIRAKFSNPKKKKTIPWASVYIAEKGEYKTITDGMYMPDVTVNITQKCPSHAPAYQTNIAYLQGDRVTVNGERYKCKANLPYPEAWTPSHWDFDTQYIYDPVRIAFIEY